MKYSVESLEFLKEKSTITYDEAVELLKKHDGDVVMAIVELEKMGKLKPEAQNKGEKAKKGQEKKKNGKLNNLFHKLMAHRLIIKKEDVVIANISWLFIIISVCTAPWLVAFAFAASLFLGYKYSRTVMWSLSGNEIKDLGQKAVENIKEFTNKVLETEPAENKQEIIKEAEKLAQEVIEKEDNSLGEIVIEP